MPSVDKQRLDSAQALALLEHEKLLDLGIMADAQRRKRYPDNKVTFVIDRNVNYTNICTTKCKFCAFYRDIEDPEAYLLELDEIFEKVDETIKLEGTQLMLQGGLHPNLDLQYYVDLLRAIKDRFSIHIHSFSPPEITHDG